jgi:hypothetical protein
MYKVWTFLIREQRSPSVISASNDKLKPSNHKKEEENISTPSLPLPQVIEYSAQTCKTNIDDYVILDSLGQGAYGLVKLAIKRDDPEQVKVFTILGLSFIYFIYLFVVFYILFRQGL